MTHRVSTRRGAYRGSHLHHAWVCLARNRVRTSCGSPGPGQARGRRSRVRYRIANVPLWLDEEDSLLRTRAAAKLQVEADAIRDLAVVRRSLDARRKGHPRWLLTLEVGLEGEIGGSRPDVAPAPEPEPPPPRARPPAVAPLVVG